MSAASAQQAPSAGAVFVEHGYAEKQVDLGEVVMNYAETGDPDAPPLLLIPGQSESWWGYEQAMGLLEADHHVFAVDVRGQGRTTRTPRRYTLDNIGNDLVRFIAAVIDAPTVVAGNSSGGVLAAWLSAFALPGQIRGALLEDPPLFSGELAPPYGHSQRQSSGPVLELWHRYIGDQWAVGDWTGFLAAARRSPSPLARMMGSFEEVPQAFAEYDPEWSRAFLDGTMEGSTPNDLLLAQVKAPIMLTHHARSVDDETGALIGALSDLQARKVSEIVAAAGVPFVYRSCPDAMHAMHASEPGRFAETVTEFASTLPR